MHLFLEDTPYQKDFAMNVLLVIGYPDFLIFLVLSFIEYPDHLSVIYFIYILFMTAHECLITPDRPQYIGEYALKSRWHILHLRKRLIGF